MATDSAPPIHDLGAPGAVNPGTSERNDDEGKPQEPFKENRPLWEDFDLDLGKKSEDAGLLFDQLYIEGDGLQEGEGDGFQEGEGGEKKDDEDKAFGRGIIFDDDDNLSRRITRARALASFAKNRLDSEKLEIFRVVLRREFEEGNAYSPENLRIPQEVIEEIFMYLDDKGPLTDDYVNPAEMENDTSNDARSMEVEMKEITEQDKDIVRRICQETNADKLLRTALSEWYKKEKAQDLVKAINSGIGLKIEDENVKRQLKLDCYILMWTFLNYAQAEWKLQHPSVSNLDGAQIARQNSLKKSSEVHLADMIANGYPETWVQIFNEHVATLVQRDQFPENVADGVLRLHLPKSTYAHNRQVERVKGLVDKMNQTVQIPLPPPPTAEDAPDEDLPIGTTAMPQPAANPSKPSVTVTFEPSPMDLDEPESASSATNATPQAARNPTRSTNDPAAGVPNLAPRAHPQVRASSSAAKSNNADDYGSTAYKGMKRSIHGLYARGSGHSMLIRLNPTNEDVIYCRMRPACQHGGDPKKVELIGKDCPVISKTKDHTYLSGTLIENFVFELIAEYEGAWNGGKPTIIFGRLKNDPDSQIMFRSALDKVYGKGNVEYKIEELAGKYRKSDCEKQTDTLPQSARPTKNGTGLFAGLNTPQPSAHGGRDGDLGFKPFTPGKSRKALAPQSPGECTLHLSKSNY